MLHEIDPRSQQVPEDLRFETMNGGVLGPYEVSYDVRRGYEAAPPPAPRRRPVDRAASFEARSERR
jgi:hypothetical protein